MRRDLKITWVSDDRIDDTCSAAADRSVRLTEPGMVESIECLEAKLQDPLRDRKFLKADWSQFQRPGP